MQWWNDFVDWISSDSGWRVVSTTILPFVAIVLAGVIGALLGRGSTRRVLELQDRQLQAAAVAAMIDAGRTATMWSSLASGAQEHADSQFIASDIRLRLLPTTGASAAADWATHELKSMRRDSASFSFQAEQTYVEYRDRLLEWQRRPGRARKLFALDLERFRFEDSSADTELVEQQRRWAAEQAAVAQEEVAAPEPEPTPAPEPVTYTAPGPVTPTYAAPEPVTAYAMPVAATEHVNEAEDAEPVSSEPFAFEPVTEAVIEPEPHVESEEDPADELDGVEVVDPEQTSQYENDVPEQADQHDDEPADQHDEQHDEQPDPQATQAMPLVEPYSYRPVTAPVSTLPQHDPGRD